MKTTNWIIALATLANLLVFAYSIKLFKKANIEIQAGEQLEIDHEWGNFALTQYFSIKNIGDKQGSLIKINGVLRRKEDKSIVTKFSKVYLERNGFFPLFVEAPINPNEFYLGNIQLMNDETYENKKNISGYKTFIYNYIDTMQKYNRNSIVGLRNEDFSQIKTFVDNRIRMLKEGEYEYMIRIFSNYSDEPIFEKAYSFILFNNDIDQLKRKSINYQNGLHIYYTQGLNMIATLRVNPSLTKIEDPIIKNELKSILDK